MVQTYHTSVYSISDSGNRDSNKKTKEERSPPLTARSSKCVIFILFFCSSK